MEKLLFYSLLKARLSPFGRFRGKRTPGLQEPASCAMLPLMDGMVRILVVDRSELAANMYRLLLSSQGVSIIVRKRFEEARPHFYRREAPSLAIFNSNIFGKKFPEVLRHMSEEEPLRRVSKIFLCRESPHEEIWRESLEKLPNSRVMGRPFHPDEFADIVGKATGRDETGRGS